MNYDRCLINLSLLICFSCPALGFSQAGTFEINSACVESGCFEGDTPGLPVQIYSPGVYTLTSDLEIDSLDSHAILIHTQDVVLEFSGFELRGPNVCEGKPLTCQNGSGNGVIGSGKNITVRDGAIRGFGQWGLAVGEGGKILNMTGENNGSYAFRAGDGSIVRNSSAYRNGSGFWASRSVLFDSIVAINNRQFGVALNGSSDKGGGSSLRNCKLAFNGEAIYDWDSSLIENCQIIRNQAGIRSGNGGTNVVRSQLMSNTRAITHVGGSSVYDISLPIVVRDTTILNNELGIQNNGEMFFVGSTVCDDPLCSD